MDELHGVFSKTHSQQGLVMFYSKLNMDQVASTYVLFRFLERLGVIGHIIAHTEQVEVDSGDIFGQYEIHDFTGADYAIVKDGYTSDKRHIDAITELERIFGRLAAPQLRGTD